MKQQLPQHCDVTAAALQRTFVGYTVTASGQQKDDSITETEQGNQWPKMGKQQLPTVLHQLCTGMCTNSFPPLLHRACNFVPAELCAVMLD